MEIQDSRRPDRDELLYRPIYETGRGFYITAGMLLLVVLWAAYMYLNQVRSGLGVTGMNQPVTWGFYIVNFVFFIGISHAGTLISAILRLSKAEWRRPITRMAEVITAIVLAIGGLHPILDLGRPDRMVNIFLSGRLQSPLLWDVTSITAYFTASTVYLYVPMIPDIAKLRDRGGKFQWLYAFMAWGWEGTEHQKKVLNRAINILMVMVIPIAVSVHTVISYIFSMTLQPGWHSTIFGPYFVVGAIFSGIAALLIVMIAFRKFYHLEKYLHEIHFQYLSTLLLIMSIIWFYFTFSEYLTGVFGAEPHEMQIIMYKFKGPFAIFFWGMVACNFVIPVIILAFKRFKTIRGILVASCTVVIGMWLERLIIVVPSLANPRMDLPLGIYVPTVTEWALFAGGLAVFVLGYMVFSKFFPIISIWEIEEGRTEGLKEVEERIHSYLPAESASS
ncbi:MAG TPA: NrfD/PsrC family molybdoenzyme membrane anchor subunit [Bacteroidota bacterium]|jgi:molybdopterin-containing oxidoreductase family membrane subunit|nr:NrfD/PsrC family molybdoenzyme membrane anchor subunit [Bacteroidota bacterium]